MTVRPKTSWQVSPLPTRHRYTAVTGTLKWIQLALARGKIEFGVIRKLTPPYFSFANHISHALLYSGNLVAW